MADESSLLSPGGGPLPDESQLIGQILLQDEGDDRHDDATFGPLEPAVETADEHQDDSDTLGMEGPSHHWVQQAALGRSTSAPPSVLEQEVFREEAKSLKLQDIDWGRPIGSPHTHGTQGRDLSFYTSGQEGEGDRAKKLSTESSSTGEGRSPPPPLLSADSTNQLSSPTPHTPQQHQKRVSFDGDPFPAAAGAAGQPGAEKSPQMEQTGPSVVFPRTPSPVYNYEQTSRILFGANRDQQKNPVFDPITEESKQQQQQQQQHPQQQQQQPPPQPPQQPPPPQQQQAKDPIALHPFMNVPMNYGMMMMPTMPGMMGMGQQQQIPSAEGGGAASDDMATVSHTTPEVSEGDGVGGPLSTSNLSTISGQGSKTAPIGPPSAGTTAQQQNQQQQAMSFYNPLIPPFYNMMGMAGSGKAPGSYAPEDPSAAGSAAAVGGGVGGGGGQQQQQPSANFPNFPAAMMSFPMTTMPFPNMMVHPGMAANMNMGGMNVGFPMQPINLNDPSSLNTHQKSVQDTLALFSQWAANNPSTSPDQLKSVSTIQTALMQQLQSCQAMMMQGGAAAAGAPGQQSQQHTPTAASLPSAASGDAVGVGVGVPMATVQQPGGVGGLGVGGVSEHQHPPPAAGGSDANQHLGVLGKAPAQPTFGLGGLTMAAGATAEGNLSPSTDKRGKRREKEKQTGQDRRHNPNAPQPHHTQGGMGLAQQQGRGGQGAHRGGGQQQGRDGDSTSLAPLPEGCTPLLEEFRRGKRKFELTDILPNIVEFAQDQFGSRFIQQKLETVGDEEKQAVFLHILPEASKLTTDVFGNYVIQKFFEHGSNEQKRILAEQLVGEVLRLSLQMYGCRVIQKALESISVDQQVLLVGELKNHVIKCVEDQNGNHVIQKCIEKMPQDKIQFVIDAFRGQIQRMSVHCYGCRVIQRLLEYCSHTQIACLLDEISRYIPSLAQDQYGNYVVQHVLEFGRPPDKDAVITLIKNNIKQYSTHKFASNVVEKSIQFVTPEQRKDLISAALGDPADPNPPILTMMRDRYANYVVQRMLETAEGHQKDMLVVRLSEQLHTLKKFTYGKHIVTALERINRQRAGLDDSSLGGMDSLTPRHGSTPTNLSAHATPTSMQGGAQPNPMAIGTTPPLSLFGKPPQTHTAGGAWGAADGFAPSPHSMGRGTASMWDPSLTRPPLIMNLPPDPSPVPGGQPAPQPPPTEDQSGHFFMNGRQPGGFNYFAMGRQY